MPELEDGTYKINGFIIICDTCKGVDIVIESAKWDDYGHQMGDPRLKCRNCGNDFQIE